MKSSRGVLEKSVSVAGMAKYGRFYLCPHDFFIQPSQIEDEECIRHIRLATPAGSDDLSGRHYRRNADTDYYRDHPADRGHTNRGYSRDRYDTRDRERREDRRGRSWDPYDERGGRHRDRGPDDGRDYSPERRGRRGRPRREEADRRPEQGRGWGFWGDARHAGAGYGGSAHTGGEGWYSSAASYSSSAGVPSRAYLGAGSQARAFYQPYILRPSSVRSFSDETTSDSEEYLQTQTRKRGSTARCLCVSCAVLLLALIASTIGVAVYFSRESQVASGSAGVVDEDMSTTPMETTMASMVTTESPGCGGSEWTCDNGVCISQSALCDANNDCGDFSDEINTCGSSTATGFVTFSTTFSADLADSTSEEFQDTSDLLCGLLTDSFASGTFLGCDTIQFLNGSVEWYYVLYLVDPSQFDYVQQTTTSGSTDQSMFASYAPVTDIQAYGSNGEAFYECSGSPCQNGGICVDIPDHFYCICSNGWIDRLCRTPVEVPTTEAPIATTEEPGCDSSEWTCDNGICINQTALCDSNNDCGDFSDETSACGDNTATGIVSFEANYTAELADPSSQEFQDTSDYLCGLLTDSFADGTFSGCNTIEFVEGSVEWHYVTFLTNSSLFDSVQEAITTGSSDQSMFGSFAPVSDIQAYGPNGTAFQECKGVPCQNNGTCMDIPDHFYCVCTDEWAGRFCITPIDEAETEEPPRLEVTGTTPSTTTTTTLRPCVGDEMTCYNGLCFNSSAVCDGINDCGDWTDETVNCTENAAGTVTFEVSWEPTLADTESDAYVNTTKLLCDEVINALPDPTLVISCDTIAFTQGSVEWTYFLKLRNESVFEEVQSVMVDASTAQAMFKDFAPVVYIETFAFTECDASPCQNNGSCYDIDGIYHCLCPEGWWGLHCDQNDASCEAEVNPCNELGTITCINYGYEFYCPCHYGFTGQYCEIEMNECDSNPCLNGATCDDCFNGYNCICQDGTTGTHCETDLNDCLSDPCVYGVCVNDVGHFTCNCDPGYTGLMCEVDIDDCAADPCENNGTCIDLINGFQCNCECGYEGETCSTKFSTQSSMPSSCQCNCECGCEGETCPTNIDECASSPCLNGATCIDLVGEYYCDCVPGYTGDECATDTNECASDPCQHGGTCVDEVDAYTCNCGLDAIGTNCETEVDYGFGTDEDTEVSSLTMFTTVSVSTNIAFHGISYSEYNILAGGFVTFNKTYDEATAIDYIYCGLDQGTDPTLSPYDDYHHPWNDGTGAIYYRETSNSTLLLRAQYDVCSLYSYYARGYLTCTFTPTALSIISWVGMWPGVDGVATRDFQVVIATDGTQSFAIYLYKNITTDCASKCLKVTGYEDPAAIMPDNFMLYPGLKDTLARGTDRIVYYMGTSDNPCSSSPCTNGGECIPTDDGGYFCDCLVDFTGETCQLATTSGFIYY